MEGFLIADVVSPFVNLGRIHLFVYLFIPDFLFRIVFGIASFLLRGCS